MRWGRPVEFFGMSVGERRDWVGVRIRMIVLRWWWWGWRLGIAAAAAAAGLARFNTASTTSTSTNPPIGVARWEVCRWGRYISLTYGFWGHFLCLFKKGGFLNEKMEEGGGVQEDFTLLLLWYSNWVWKGVGLVYSIIQKRPNLYDFDTMQIN